ncbi:mucin-5AC-like [Eriocheir sinensis]|uniref:mucin-5AC-like n=1 Tax=Eriocheir sinensis TaxID=95602 RepID=UPI0021C83C68|nr:mucin-5AC-like [Eriocheir sinensis]
MLNYPSCPKHCPFASTDHVSDAPSRISPEAPVSSPGQITIPLIPLTDLLDPRLTPPRQSTDPSGLRLSPPGTVKFPRTSPRDPTASTSSHDDKDIRRTDNHQHSPVSSFSTGVSKRTSSGLRCSYLRQSPTTTTTTATTTAVNTSLTTTTTTTSPTVLTCQYLHRSPPETPSTTGTTSTTPTTHKCPYLQNSRVTTAVSTPTATDVTNTTVNTTSTCAATNTTIISTTTSSSTKCSYLHKAQTVTTTNASVSITNVTTKSTPQCPYLQALPRPSTSTTSSTNANTPTATNSITSNTNNNKNGVCEYLHRNATTTSSSNTVICQYLHNNQSPGNTTTTNTTNTTHTITNGSTGSANNISNIRTNNRNKNNHSTTKHEVIRNDRQRKKSRQENSRSSHLEGNGYKQERVITPPGRDTRSSEAVTIPQTNLKALHGSTVVSELGAPRTNGRVGQLFEKSNISGEPADEGRVNILPLEARGGGRSANTGHLEESPIESSVAHTTRPEAAKDWSHKCDYLKHAATSSTTNNNNNNITTNTTSRNDSMQITPVSTSKQNCEIPDRIALEISPTGTSFPCPPPFPFSTVSPRREPAGSSGHNSSQTSQISGFISKDGSTTRTFLKNTGEQGNAPNVIDDRGSGRGITCHYLRQASGAAAKTSRLTCEFLEKNHGCIDKLNGTTKGKEEMVRGKAERGEQRPPRKNQVYIDDNKAPNYTGKTFGDEAKIVSQSQQNFYQSRLSYQDLSAPVLTHLNGSPSSPQAISGRKGEAASVPFSAARGDTPQPSTRASIKPADRGPRADPGSVHAPPCDGTFRATRCRTYSPTLFHPKFSIHRLAVRERDEGNFSPSPPLTSWEVLKMSLGPCPVRDAGRSDEEEDGKEEEEPPTHSQTASKLQRPGSQPKGGVRGPRKAELPATQEGRNSVSSVTCRMDPAVPPTTLSGAKTCGFLLRVQEVLRSLPGREAPLTTAAPETVTGGDK